mmetsp:Transcript_7116/g.12893  ORF Transcript_7116/g.12893 Transcript_7116/m.12893 type:complete len:252 (-) Transcript_7116:997-1752(-)
MSPSSRSHWSNSITFALGSCGRLMVSRPGHHRGCSFRSFSGSLPAEAPSCVSGCMFGFLIHPGSRMFAQASRASCTPVAFALRFGDAVPPAAPEASGLCCDEERGTGLPRVGSTTSSAHVSRRPPLSPLCADPLPFRLLESDGPLFGSAIPIAAAGCALSSSWFRVVSTPSPIAGGGSLDALRSNGGAGGGAPSSGDGRGLALGLSLVPGLVLALPAAFGAALAVARKWMRAARSASILLASCALVRSDTR